MKQGAASADGSDVAVLRTWWAANAEEVGHDVHGLLFGLFDQIARDGSRCFTMYVAGTSDFDQRDGDWASDYIWWPSDRYLRLDDLAAFDSADWAAALDHAVDVVTTVAPWDTAPTTVRGVGVGFDDGDIRIVWTALDRDSDRGDDA